MNKDLSWRLVTSVCVAVSVRFFIQDSVMYLITCFVIGIILAAIGEYLDSKK